LLCTLSAICGGYGASGAAFSVKQWNTLDVIAFMAHEELDFTVNKLIFGDNLEILKSLPAECVDLIYLDPPFFSNRNYEVIWGDAGGDTEFSG
jgi:16S rRNA G966 N2-methylase RsmD